MMRSVGFTGTQNGMTASQTETVRMLLWVYGPDQAHHGDCIGADAQFDALCAADLIYRIAHPGCGPDGAMPKRAHCEVQFAHDPKPYLDRNRDIVDETGMLIACPSSRVEQMRSGTWATIRHARKTNRPHIVVFPDGSWRVGANSTYWKDVWTTTDRRTTRGSRRPSNGPRASANRTAATTTEEG